MRHFAVGLQEIDISLEKVNTLINLMKAYIFRVQP